MNLAPLRPGAPTSSPLPARGLATFAPWLAALVLAGMMTSCGQNPQVAPSAPAATPTGGTVTPPASPVQAPLASIAVAGSANHTVYATRGISCEQCHPCGQRIAGGHGVAWMDTASPGFHASAANGGLAACGTCHGAALDGVGGTTTIACSQCHGSSWRTSCTFCHGGTASTTGAPPKATWGNSADAVRVGAHTAHLGATHGLAAAVTCVTCHVVPTDALSAGHVASGIATVTFSGLASAGVTTAPSWSRTAATCSNVYCHGGKYAGNAAYAGSATSPRWTDTAATAAACGSCHKAPPTSSAHSSVTTTTSCSTCHTGYACTTASLAACSVNAATHLNGAVDVANMTCTSCHGNKAQTATAAAPLHAAPPVDAAGLATGGFRIGAHQKHLTGTTYTAAPVACATCHSGVGSYTTSHGNGTRDVGFAGAPNANLRKGTWTASTGTVAGSCASTWCHGAVTSPSGTASGGTLTRPAWTGTITACTACHAVVMTSLTNRHTLDKHRGLACTTCHGAGYTSTVSSGVSTGTAVSKATHVDGIKTIVTTATGTGIRTYNPTNRNCTASCHGSKTW